MSAYISKPIPLHIVFAAQTGVIQTLEGPVSHQVGDAIVTGTAGERWPISRERFERTYRPADQMGRMGRDGWFVKEPVVVQAVRAQADARVSLGGERGTLAAQGGDWILTGPAGDSWVVADGIFQQMYEPWSEGAG